MKKYIIPITLQTEVELNAVLCASKPQDSPSPEKDQPNAVSKRLF